MEDKSINHSSFQPNFSTENSICRIKQENLECLIKKWTTQQEEWKQCLITDQEEPFTFIGGLDITPEKVDDSVAYVGFVVLNTRTLEIEYSSCQRVSLEIPYIPGYLGFREAPALVQVVQNLKKEHPSLLPSVLLVDGNGVLHPRGFGSACHLGVSLDIPTIGVAKSLLHVDGLDSKQIRTKMKEYERWMPLFGNSGSLLGAAILSTQDVKRPIFVSIGYRIGLLEAITLVLHTCHYRIPQPIRLADQISRQGTLHVHTKCRE
eukprot:jgi/Galph1/1252/GphlegSOOS_G6085.1